MVLFLAYLFTATCKKYKFDMNNEKLFKDMSESLYPDRDVFIRELASNAIDSLAKRQVDLLAKQMQGNVSNEELCLYIKVNADEKKILFIDNGIGLSEEECIKYIGSVGTSGSAEYKKNNESIDGLTKGQFGLGFYSSFGVAHTVELFTHKDGHKPTKFYSTGFPEYVVEDVEEDIPIGSTVVCHLRDDALTYMNTADIEKVLKKYMPSDTFPIYIEKTMMEEREIEMTEEERSEERQRLFNERLKESEGNEEVNLEFKDEDVPRTKKVMENVTKYVRVNKTSVLVRSPETVTHEEYLDFMKMLVGKKKGFRDYFGVSHFRFEMPEGEVFVVLYVPDGYVKEDQYSPKKRPSKIKLVVKNLVLSSSSLVLPDYLSFMVGVVRADFIKPNMVRDTAIKSPEIELIRKRIIDEIPKLLLKTSETLEENRRETYMERYSSVIRNIVISMGSTDTDKNKTLYMEALRFPTTLEGPKSTSLKEYFSRMKEGQENIYFFNCTDVDLSRKESLLMDYALRTEVLFGRVQDDLLFQHFGFYRGKRLLDIRMDTKGFFDVTPEDKERFTPLLKRFKSVLMDEIQNVRLSKRLTKLPFLLTTTKMGFSPTMRKMIMGQSGTQGDFLRKVMRNQRLVLEINPRSSLIEALLENMDHTEFDVIVRMLYLSAQIDGGYDIKYPYESACFVQMIVGRLVGCELEKPEMPEINEAIKNDKEKEEKNEEEDDGMESGYMSKQREASLKVQEELRQERGEEETVVVNNEEEESVIVNTNKDGEEESVIVNNKDAEEVASNSDDDGSSVAANDSSSAANASSTAENEDEKYKANKEEIINKLTDEILDHENLMNAGLGESIGNVDL